MRRPSVLLALVISATLAGCGTGAFLHRFEITIADPSGRLGEPPYELSVFDPQMGGSEEWARKTMGVAGPGTPFVTTYSAVETKMMFDAAPAPRVNAALWLPGYQKSGYFALRLEPEAGREVTATLPFVPWADSSPEGPKVPPLTARVRGETNQGAWLLRVTIDVP